MEQLLKENSDDDEEFENLTMGVDFETQIYSQLSYQTFMLTKSGEVEEHGKIRIAICFSDNKKKNKAMAILRRLAQHDPISHPWRVYELKPKKHYLYFDTDIFSMLVHWLTSMDLAKVCSADVTSNMLQSFFYIAR